MSQMLGQPLKHAPHVRPRHAVPTTQPPASSVKTEKKAPPQALAIVGVALMALAVPSLVVLLWKSGMSSTVAMATQQEAANASSHLHVAQPVDPRSNCSPSNYSSI